MGAVRTEPQEPAVGMCCKEALYLHDNSHVRVHVARGKLASGSMSYVHALAC